MIRRLLSALFLSVCCLCVSAQDKHIVLDKTGSNYHKPLTINRFDSKGISISAKFDTIAFSDAKTLKGDFCELQIEGAYRTGAIGEPQLPAMRKLVKIPHGTTFKVDIKCTDTAVYSLADIGIEKKITPRQPSQSKSDTRTKYKHKKRSYRRNYFTEQQLVSVTKVGTMRDADYYQIAVNPVRYNPKQNKIELFNNIDIDIHFEGNASKSDANTLSPYFDNSKSGSDTTYTDLTKYPVKYLIITDTAYLNALQDFIFWKRQKGFDVVVATTDKIGKTSAAIKSWVASQYNAATEDSPAPSFLLLAADTDKIPCSETGESSGKGTDLYYACMDGADDIIPDIYYGRFSARTAEQMKAIADKTIAYEKFQFADSSYLGKATLIAGYDGNYRSSIGIPTVNYLTKYRINANNGYSTVNPFTSSYSNCYADTSISVGLVTYTAHGTSTTWMNPELTQSKVNSFSNAGKFPFVIANCCYSGNIVTSECLGETWLRKKNGGAVAYIGSSPQTWWHEDFYWAVGAHNYKSGVCPDTSATTIGAFDAPFVSDFNCGDALVFAGNLAVAEAHDNNYPDNVSTRYYWEAYNYLGDPSLLVYFGMPQANSVSHELALPIGIQSVTVNALEGSYIAISKDSVLLGAAVVKRGQTSATISIPAVNEPGQLNVVVTKAQRKPYFGKITLIVPNKPFLVMSGASTSTLDNDSTRMLNIALQNLGNVAAENVRINSITSTSSYVKSITPINYTVGELQYQTPDTIAACQIALRKNIPDQTVIPFVINVSDNETFVFNYRLTIDAPNIHFNPNITVSGGNTFMPGDTVDLGITITNNGHTTLTPSTITIAASSNQPFIHILNSSCNIDTLAVNESATCFFKVYADTDTDLMSDFYFDVAISNADASYRSSNGYAITIGEPLSLQVGNGNNSPNDYPFNNYYECSITNILYTTNDLGDKPLKIKSIGFDISQATPASEHFGGYLNFTIKAKPVSNSALSSFVNMDDAETIYTKDNVKLPTTPEHITFELDKDYNYDGKTNFVIEIKWGDNGYYASSGNRTKVWSHTTPTNTVAYGIEDNWSEFDFDGNKSIRPNTTFGYVPCNKMLIFNVKDTDNHPVADAEINLMGEILKTDANGIVNYLYFNRIYNKDCSVSADGYYNRNININTTGDTTNVNITLTPLPKRTITIHLTDYITGADITGATVSIGWATASTNSLGIATLTVTQNTHVLTINSEEYITVSETIDVVSDNTLTIKMRQKPSLTIRTLFQDSLVGNTSVIIAGDTLKTNTNGYVRIEHIDPGEYPIILSHNSYAIANHTIKIDNRNIDTTFTLKGLPNLTFTIYADNRLASNILVTLDDRVQLTDSNGVATFAHVRTGSHTYSISGNMITTVTGTITTSFTNTNITKRLERQRSTLVFNVKDNGIPVENISVIVYGQTVRTDNFGTAMFKQIVPTESLTYTITNNNAFSMNGITAVDRDSVFINIDIAKDLVDIKFFVFDINHSPIAKANVKFNGKTIATNQNGTALFNNVRKGSVLDYTVSMDKYDKANGSITCDSSFMVNIMLQQQGEVQPKPIACKIAFCISNDTAPINDVSVIMNNIEKLTDNSGFAVFEDTAGTVVNYIVSKENYQSINGEARIIGSFTCNSDTTINISLSELPPISAITSTEAPIFTIYPNPSDGLLHIQDYEGQEFMLCDMNGRRLKTITVECGQIDLRPISSGIYMLTTNISGKLVSCTIIIR